MEAIRRMLSKEGLSAKDKKDRAALQKRIDDATAKAKAKSKAAAKKRMMDDAPKGRGGKAANIMSKVKDTAPPTTGKRKISDKNKTKVVGGFKKVGTKDPDAGRKQQGQITKKAAKVKDKAPMGKGTPKTVGAAQKSGSMFFFKKNKDGSQTKMLAVTAEQKKKLGMSLTAIANKYKGKDGMKRMLADLKKKKMAMGGAAMKKKGMAMGGMKKKGYAMGGLKATNPSQVGLRKLPQSVRNKMGYMKKGGMTKKGYARGGSMKKKGYAMGGVAKKYGMVDNRKKKR
tara:strand:- start:44 stop:898 length:855 start_codon:yes stop_codon:yes gene_type:complete